MASRLKLSFSRLISDRPPSHKLPLPFNRALGTVDDVNNSNSGNNGTDKPVIPQGLKNSSLVGCHVFINKKANLLASCHDAKSQAVSVHNCLSINKTDVIHINQCYQLTLQNALSLNACNTTTANILQNLTACFYQHYISLILLVNCQSSKVTDTLSYQTCSPVELENIRQLSLCNQQLNEVTIGFKQCLNHDFTTRNLHKCQQSTLKKAVDVPCRYYPIPPKPPLPPSEYQRTCPIRPPSSHLPIAFVRKSKQYRSSHLPLPFACWHDTPSPQTPNEDTYIMPNTINSTIAGINIEPLSFSIKTDIDSYCWQGSVEISPSDYEKIKTKLNAPRGNEPLINVIINKQQFSFLAENTSRSRQFVNHSFNISGRSLSARLGADYIKTGTGMITQDSYARQIINEQLADLPIELDEFLINDWFIPANNYSTANKTPIAVIADIANACGGFVVSDCYQAKLSIKPRYKVSAWELATAKADVILPLDVLYKVDDSKNKQPFFNTVTLTSNVEGGVVYRQQLGRDLSAPTENNELLTAREAIVAKGLQILSDSGTHSTYNLTVAWSDNHQLALAKLGDIWQINDDEGAFKAVVTSVAIDVKINDGVPIIWQNVNLDRYLDI